jgi:hypothetical protein
LTDELDYINGIWGDEGGLFHDEFKAQLDADAKKRAEDDQLISDYKTALSTPAGRRVMLDILIRARIFETTFTGNSRGMFYEGQRAMGLYILHMFQSHKFKGDRE